MIKLTFKTLSTKTWKDFENLFGENGACGGCWCMWWRLKNSDFKKFEGDGNKKKMFELVKKNEPIGILAYHKNLPVGWCSISPRKNLIRLENSRNLSPIDEKEVWSINCFFVKKDFRKKGITSALIKESEKFVKKFGGKILEAYPIDKKNYPDAFAYVGLINPFLRNGFKEVLRRSKNRPIVRKNLK